ncbi:MAG TPA: phosphate-starvation-inducible PsiE family protein [Vicinamibacterales bacterium]|nr:phosphate-starvation-inducible PsiE family protein [Vicinamibacterales bacterium]
MAADQPVARGWIARAFTLVEDVVYVGLGVILGASAVALLVGGAAAFVSNIAAGRLAVNIIPLLDRILLILLVVELLYTVQVSFREHTLVPEPFLLIGLIAVIRRVLVLTAEYGQLRERSEVLFRQFVVELAVLAALILVIALSLLLLRRRAGRRAPRAGG